MCRNLYGIKGLLGDCLLPTPAPGCFPFHELLVEFLHQFLELKFSGSNLVCQIDSRLVNAVVDIVDLSVELMELVRDLSQNANRVCCMKRLLWSASSFLAAARLSRSGFGFGFLGSFLNFSRSFSKWVRLSTIA